MSKRSNEDPVVRGGRARRLFGVAAALVATAFGPSAQDEDRLEKLQGVIAAHRAEDDVRAQALVDRVRLLGASVVPEILGMIASSVPPVPRPVPPGPVEPLQEDELDALFGALAAWDESEVAERLLGLLGGRATLDEQLAAVRILGAVGSANAIPTLAQVTALVPASERRHPLYTRAFEEALFGILVRDGHGFRVLEDVRDEIDGGLTPVIVRALGRTGDWRALSALERELRTHDVHDVTVIRALSLVHGTKHVSTEFRDGAIELVREELGAKDPAVRQEAAVTLGRLRAGAAAEALVGLLAEDEEPRVQSAAHWALQEITGLRFSPSPARWRAWIESESDWYRRVVPDLRVRVAERDPGKAAAAIREVQGHPVYARELAPMIARALGHSSAEVVVTACTALARLGDPCAHDPLTALADDPRGRVRDAAAAALGTLGHTAPR